MDASVFRAEMDPGAYAQIEILLRLTQAHNPELDFLIPKWYVPGMSREDFLKKLTDEDAERLTRLPFEVSKAATHNRSDTFVIFAGANIPSADQIIEAMLGQMFSGISSTVDPLDVLASDLQLALRGEKPGTDASEYLRLFHLDGDERDSQTLIERVAISFSFGKIRQTIRLLEFLLENYEHGDRKEGTVEMISILAVILDRQLEREGNVCPAAALFANRLLAVTPTLLSEKARQALKK